MVQFFSVSRMILADKITPEFLNTLSSSSSFLTSQQFSCFSEQNVSHWPITSYSLLCQKLS